MLFSNATEELKSRFFNKVGATDFSNDKCHIWPAAKSGMGYGYMQWQGKVEKASRIMWSLYNECDIPDGMEIMHLCDSPSCVNPAHLSVGSHKSNMRDMIRKGRHRNGSKVKTLGYVNDLKMAAI